LLYHERFRGCRRSTACSAQKGNPTSYGDHAAKYGIILQRYTLGCQMPALQMWIADTI